MVHRMVRTQSIFGHSLNVASDSIDQTELYFFELFTVLILFGHDREPMAIKFLLSTRTQNRHGTW